MHAFLLVGNNPNEELAARIKTWKISSWDTIRIPEEGTIGIEMIRNFEHDLSLSPRNSPAKVGVIHSMERLTVEAQNALLKTLEEPPPHTYIIGTTVVPEALLPTVLSRMSVVKLTISDTRNDTTLLTKLLGASPGKRLALLEPYVSTRDDAKKLVVSLLGAAETELRTHPTRELAALAKKLLEAQSQLSVNVNPRLVVDNAIV